MLLDSFFHITQIEVIAPQRYRVLVRLVPEHRVYEGHFPEDPVTPGVCTLQMVAECAGKALGCPVVMQQAKVVKFLEVIRPSSNKDLEIDLLFDHEMTVKATVTSNERLVMSCRLKLIHKT